MLKFDFCRHAAAHEDLQRFINRSWNPENVAKRSDEKTAFLNSLQLASKQRQVVVFIAVHQGNFPSIEFIAHGFKADENLSIHGIYINSPPPENLYSTDFFCKGSLAVFYDLISSLPGITVYLQSHAKWIFLNPLLRQSNPKLTIYNEVYDWMEPLVGENQEFFDKEGLFSILEMEWIKDGEEYVRNNSDGYLYKGGGSWMDGVLKRAISPSLHMLPCNPKAWNLPPAGKTDIDDSIRLVYTGQIKASSDRRELLGHMNFLPMIDDLSRQGVSVTIYIPTHFSEDQAKSTFCEYYNLAEKSPLFEIKMGVVQPALFKKLHGAFTFGLMINYLDADNKVGIEHFHEAVSSKIFTYLASGLPVLIGEEYRFMAKLITTEGVGVVISREQLNNLDAALADVDYQQLLVNVERFQKKYNIEAFLPKLKEFMGL
ncbi:MAG: hypothetical protein HQL70_02030 [Magnetococcales bacterium]|nr:hypothetical protein [Magnetococcales bacterium]